MRDKKGYGEKSTGAKIIKEEQILAWDILPQLKPYKSAIWDKYISHWLTPFETFCQTCPELTYDFIDTNGTVFVDLHPSPRQYVLWLELELKDKLELSDQLFIEFHTAVDNINKLHTKFKSNKQAFEFSLIHKLIECDNRFKKSVDTITGL